MNRLLFLLALILAACAPTTPESSSESPGSTGVFGGWGNYQGSYQGVWLQKEIAFQFRSQHKSGCQLHLSPSPDAFVISEDGLIELLSSGSAPVAIGQINAKGNLKEPGLFEKIELHGDTLIVYNSLEPHPVSYLRSTQAEVQQALLPGQNCMRPLSHAIGASSWPLDPADMVMEGFSTLGVLDYFYNVAQARKAQAMGAVIRQEHTLEMQQIKELSVQSVGLMQERFDALLTLLSKRLPPESRWSQFTEADKSSVRLLYFDGSFDLLVGPGQAPDEYRFIGAVEKNGVLYDLVPGGKIRLSAKERQLLATLRRDFRNMKSQERLLQEKADHLFLLADKQLNRAKFRRNVSGAVVILFVSAQALYSWYKIHSESSFQN